MVRAKRDLENLVWDNIRHRLAALVRYHCHYIDQKK